MKKKEKKEGRLAAYTKRKIRICIIIIVAGMLICSAVLAAGALFGKLDSRLADNAAMLKRFKTSYNNYDNDFNLSDLDDEKFSKSVSLTASAIRESSSDNPEAVQGVRLFEDGCIFRYDGSDAEFPDGLPADLCLDEIRPDDDTGIFLCLGPDESDVQYESYQCAYSRIRDDLYYMEWLLLREGEFLFQQYDNVSLHKSIFSAHGADVIVVYSDDDEPVPIFVETYKKYDGKTNISEIGLSPDELENALENKCALVSLNTGWHIIQCEVFYMGVVKGQTNRSKMLFLALTPVRDILTGTYGLILTFIMIMLILSVVLVVWIINIYRVVCEKDHEQGNLDDFRPAFVRKKVAVFIIVSCLVMWAGSAFAHVLNNVSGEASYEGRELSSVISSIGVSENNDKNIWEQRETEFIGAAEKTAKYLDAYPALRTRKWLREASKIIGADYIIIYDAKGKEILSDSKYRGLSLGSTEDSPTYDFRKTLNGISVSKERVKDEKTGKTNDMCGVPLKYPGNDDAYGALVVTLSSKSRAASVTTDINEILTSHSGSRFLLFAADPDTGKIVYSSNSDYIGENVSESGFSENDLKNGLLGFFDLNHHRRFGRSAENEGLLYYISSEASDLFARTGGFSFACMLMFLIILCAIAFVMLKDYDENVFSLELSEEERNAISGPRFANVLDALKIRESPFRTASLTLMILTVFCILVILGLTMLGERSMGDSDASVIRYIMYGDWEHGINIFSITVLFFIMCNVLLAVTIVYFIRIVLCSVLSSKGVTIVSLVANMLQYFILVISVLVAMSYMGVNYRALIASVGVASMVLTLGARDLVADLFAGVGLLVNGTYKIGDIIELDGFTGTVQDLNLRTTKLVGSSGNVKTIRNNQISNVVNLSARNSWYTAELTISSSKDLSTIEALLKERLPEIREKYPFIISGPDYGGIQAMGRRKITIVISTECRQADYYKVRRVVNKELHEIFAENNIIIL